MAPTPRTAALLVAAAAGLFRLRALGSPDHFWHLTGGRAVVQAGARTYADPVAVAPPGPFTNAEWGYDLLVYALGSGPAAPVLLSAVAAALSCWFVFLLARTLAGRGGGWLSVGLAAASAGVTTVRFFPRPQVAFLVLLPMTLWAAAKLARAEDERERWRWAGLGALGVGLWAQMHLSVAIAPAVLGLMVLSAPRRRDRPLLAAGAAAALLPLSGATGLGVVGQVLGHSSGEAIAHIADMQAMQLRWLWPPDGLEIALLEALLVAGAVGAATRRRLSPALLALAALGVAMMLRSHRFVAAAGILAVPWVADAWRSEREASAHRAAAALGALGLLLSAGLDWRPSLGWDREHVPVDLGRAVSALQLAGPGLSDYDAGGFLGWTRFGHARVFIDGRTPMFHEDGRYFAQRAALRDPAVFDRLAAAHAFRWAVVPRDAALCRALAADDGWGATWIDEDRALFQTATDGPSALDPCGDGPLQACTPQAAPALVAELQRLRSFVPDGAWANRQLAALGAGCARDPQLAAEALARTAAAEPAHRDLPWLGGAVALARGDVPGALDWLADADPADARAQATRAALLLERGEARAAQAVGEALLHKLGDDAPVELRRVVAGACAEQQRWRCAAEQALRGALLGHGPSADLLRDPNIAGALTPDERGLMGL